MESKQEPIYEDYSYVEDFDFKMEPEEDIEDIEVVEHGIGGIKTEKSIHNSNMEIKQEPMDEASNYVDDFEIFDFKENFKQERKDDESNYFSETASYNVQNQASETVTEEPATAAASLPFVDPVRKNNLQHTDQRPYACDWSGCALKYKRKDHLNRHKLSHLVQGPQKHQVRRSFPCDWSGCDAIYQSRNGLRYHKSRHGQGHKPYKCKWKQCTSEFLTASKLTRHKRTHTLIKLPIKKSYPCEWRECSLIFTSKDSLVYHTESHTGYPHLCDWGDCQSKFKSASTLTRHKRSHASLIPDNL